MISVNRNFGSLVGRLNLLTANNAAETAVKRLSSGSRINSAADDSAGMAVVSKMDSQITGLSVAIKNTMDAISLLILRLRGCRRHRLSLSEYVNWRCKTAMVI